EILHAAWLWQPSQWPFLLGIVGAFLTAFYMTRQMRYVFFGQRRTGILPVPAAATTFDTSAHLEGRASEHSSSSPQARETAGQAGSVTYVPHESPALMSIPLAILAGGTVVLSVFGTPVWPWFESYLSGHGGHPKVSDA